MPWTLGSTVKLEITGVVIGASQSATGEYTNIQLRATFGGVDQEWTVSTNGISAESLTVTELVPGTVFTIGDHLTSKDQLVFMPVGTMLQLWPGQDASTIAQRWHDSDMGRNMWMIPGNPDPQTADQIWAANDAVPYANKIIYLPTEDIQ